MKKNDKNANYTRRKYRVDFQVFVITAIIVVISCGFTFGVCYQLTYTGMINAMAARANSIHDYAEEKLDVESFHMLNNREDSTSALYLEAKDILEKVKTAAGVRYLYTAKEKENGEFVYLIDGLPATDSDFRYIGDIIEPECIPDMQRAMDNIVVLPEDINHTSWGDIFIAYFPMHDGEQVVGVLGIEFDASSQYHTYSNMIIAAPVIICLFCIIAAVIAVVMFRRISNPTYKDMANTDLLTDLKNRNAFEIDLHNLESMKMKRGLALVSIDLDGLKEVNDTLGHSVGDRYIQKGSNLLKACKPESSTLYRTGGDEFTIILYDASPECIEVMIEKLCRKKKVEGIAPDLEIRMSAGYAFYDEAIDGSLEDTFRRADAAMYEHKKKKC